MTKPTKDVTSQVADGLPKEYKDGDVLELPVSKIKVTVHELPPGLTVRALAQFPRPDVPSQYDEELGRFIENQDDPDYLDRVEAWQIRYSEAMLNTMIAYGTEFSSAPKKLGKPADDSWLKKFSLTGLPIERDNEDWRWLNWFMTYAKGEDLKVVQEVVGKLSGIREKDVEAATNFPGNN